MILSTASYLRLAQRIAQRTEFLGGEVEREQFPDGERYRRITTSPDGRDVVLVGGTISDEDTLELYDLACAVVKYGARTLTLVIPYFGYGTMERAERPGEIVTAKARARLLSSIPLAGAGNRVVLLDLHSPGIPYYFEGGIRPYHLSAKPLILATAIRLGGDDFVMACTDAGRAKWVEALANDLRVDASFVFKRRIDATHTEVAGINADVQGKRVIIYDDLIRSGSSLLQAAQAYNAAGATSVAAIATHGLFTDGALERLRASDLFSELACTDSHPRAVELASDFLRVETTADLLAAFLRDMPCS
jgi:ribose-phosphate pyrophosphokinase